MKILENKIPPPIVMALFMMLMWGVSNLGLTFEISKFFHSLIIIFLFSLGVFFGLSGIYRFKKAQTTVNPLKPEQASSLVTSGVYRITRNPMYVGLVFFLLAWGIYLGSMLSILCIPLFVLIMNRLQITPEERALKEVFGAEFENYQSKVRRWL